MDRGLWECHTWLNKQTQLKIWPEVSSDHFFKLPNLPCCPAGCAFCWRRAVSVISLLRTFFQLPQKLMDFFLNPLSLCFLVFSFLLCHPCLFLSFTYWGPLGHVCVHCFGFYNSFSQFLPSLTFVGQLSSFLQCILFLFGFFSSFWAHFNNLNTNLMILHSWTPCTYLKLSLTLYFIKNCIAALNEF